jgi:hypothetical protein
MEAKTRPTYRFRPYHPSVKMEKYLESDHRFCRRPRRTVRPCCNQRRHRNPPIVRYFDKSTSVLYRLVPRNYAEQIPLIVMSTDGTGGAAGERVTSVQVFVIRLGQREIFVVKWASFSGRHGCWIEYVKNRQIQAQQRPCF